MSEEKTTQTTTTQEETKSNEVKTYTEEEVTKLLNAKVQSETDKVRTEYSKKIKDAETELNKYKPKEKSDAEIELENRLKVLEDKEKEVSKKEKLLKVSETLENNGLNSQLAKYINLQGVEDLESYIGEISETIKTQINTSKLDNSYKPSNHATKKDSISKEQFMKMGYMERMNIFKSNKDLYDRLSK